MRDEAKTKPELYAEMTMKYTDFNVYVPSVGITHFSGALGERATYDALIRMRGSKIMEFTLRVHNVARAISDLTYGHYSNPDRAHRPVGAPGVIVAYGGELDGEKMRILLLVLARSSLVVTARAPDRRTGYYTEVKMSILSFGSAAHDSMQLVRAALGPFRYAEIEDDAGALHTAAGMHDRRVAFVSGIEAASHEWSELPLRIMHAAVAVLAQIGVISGSSMVVIDKRGYGWGASKRVLELERGLSESKYNYKLRSIGRYLVVVRADELVDPLGGLEVLKSIQAAEIGVLDSAALSRLGVPCRSRF